MKAARQLLVLPLLSPLLAVIVVAALNPGPALSVRVLTWVSPRAPLGLWLGGAALGGAALSGAGTALALRQGAGAGGRRRMTGRTSRPWAQRRDEEDGGWEAPAAPSRSRRREMDGQDPWAARSPGEPLGAESWRQVAVGVAPPRSPGDPPPTLDVPFRILHRPTPTGPAREREPVPLGVEDDWGGEAAADDW